MEVDDEFWNDLPIVTVWKKILVYSLRIILLPIVLILLIWGMIDLMINFKELNYEDPNLDDLTRKQYHAKEREKREKISRRHPILNFLTRFYSHEYLYGY